MENEKGVTPTTKRVCIVCLTLLGMAAIAGACFGEIEFDQALLVVVPVMTSVSAMVDSGR